MVNVDDWIWNERQQIGKDYESHEEVAVYDESHSRFRDVASENAKILSIINAKEGQSLLDIGCGTGAFAREAANRGLIVSAADVSRAMLDYARDRSSEVRSDIEWLHAGFLTIEKPQAVFDHVTTSFSLHHLPDFYKFVALRNIAKMLKSDGSLFIQDVVIAEENYEANINALIEHQESLGGDFLREDAIQHFREEYSTFDWILEGLLERAGFRIDFKEIEAGLIAWYRCIKAC